MTVRQSLYAASFAALMVVSTIAAGAAGSLSDADKDFAAKVSQGGMYEVALGTLAETRGQTQDIRDQGYTEAHDHTLVGGKLRAILAANNIHPPTQLNAHFQGMLDAFRAMPAAQFDAAYLAAMTKIHDIDGAAFAKEAASGTNPALRAFAAETHRIVERHLGEIQAEVH